MKTARIDWEDVARKNVHPLRISVLDVLAMDGGRTLSVNELRQELQVGLSKLSYHVTELHKQGILELVGEEQRRGAMEHFYRLREAA